MWQESAPLPEENMNGLTIRVADYIEDGVVFGRVGLMRATAMGTAYLWFRLFASDFPRLRKARESFRQLLAAWQEPIVFATVEERPDVARKFIRFLGFTRLPVKGVELYVWRAN